MKHISLLFIFLVSLTYSYSQYQHQKVTAIIVVMDYDNNPRKEERISFKNKRTGEIVSGISGEDGKFEVKLTTGDTYIASNESLSDQGDDQEIEIPEAQPGYKLDKIEITAQFDIPKVFTLNDVHFLSGKSALTEDSYGQLKDLVEYMELKKSATIEIAGHTDDVGSDASNMALSQKRAESVKKYLVSKGIAAERLIAKGYGESQPVASNETEEGRQQNRRTEVKILEE